MSGLYFIYVLKSFGYSVVRDLGEGGYGMVKLATSERHSQQVAIKIMDRRNESSDFNTKLLPRELAILKRARHPHIIEVLECFEMRDGLVFIVMEAAEMDLRSKILELYPGVPINQAKIWFTQLLSAMQYLHQQNIVHRDLKLLNVLLTADGQVKLTDFGLGRFSRGFPFLSRSYCGTRRYAAPEVNINRPYDPKKADVWSLGVIFYAMVTGTTPFNEQEHCSLTDVQREPLKFPAGVKVSGPCRDFISYMLRVNPFMRPSVKQVARHPWLQSREEE
uniref:non-specific serine/threonine protein kinase n=1 Tax=Astyanax mexicanus TaxID=7994 RepID=A0A3B1JHF3_ASTMX